jgi:hypothetical protein
MAPESLRTAMTPRMFRTTGFREAEPMQQGMTEMMPDLAPSPSDIRYNDLIITRS